MPASSPLYPDADVVSPDLCTICAHGCPLSPDPDSRVEFDDACDVARERSDVEAWLAGYYEDDAACPGFEEAPPGFGEALELEGGDTHPRSPGDGIVLSADQEAACRAILGALAGGTDEPLVLVGPAGTGKTTLMRELVRRVRDTQDITVTFAAPTGKAALRLRDLTGEQASTLHSLIYGRPENRGQCPAVPNPDSEMLDPPGKQCTADGEHACGKWSHDLAISKLEMRVRGMTHRTCPHCKRTFHQDVKLRTKLCFKMRDRDGERELDIPENTLIVVDEASMVNEDLDRDLLEALPDARILYVGDREQLPPVEGKWGPDFDHPTVALTRVHRQAGDNPILSVATRLRTEEARYPFSRSDNDRDARRRFSVVEGSLPAAAGWLAEMRAADEDATLITYTNAARRALNTLVREFRGLAAIADDLQIPIVSGDRLLVLSNNKIGGYWNGEVLVVEESTWLEPSKLVGPHECISLHVEGHPGEVIVPMVSHGEDRREHMAYVRAHENAWESARRSDTGNTRTLNLVDPSKFLHCDFGECLTAHKAQGSQWRHVGIAWDRSCWGMWFGDPALGRRWAYTALTRASDTLRVWYIK